MAAYFIIEDVDTATGLLFSGGNPVNYLETLVIFRREWLKKVDELLGCIESNNLSLYTTYVHALRSACANIGATKLSTKAKILEAAGAKRDLDFIVKENGDFIDGLKKLLVNIDKIVAANTEKSSSETLDDATLKRLLVKLKAGLKKFDAIAVDETSSELNGFTEFADMGEAVGEILQNAFLGNYNQAATKIEELLASHW